MTETFFDFPFHVDGRGRTAETGPPRPRPRPDLPGPVHVAGRAREPAGLRLRHRPARVHAQRRPAGRRDAVPRPGRADPLARRGDRRARASRSRARQPLTVTVVVLRPADRRAAPGDASCRRGGRERPDELVDAGRILAILGPSCRDNARRQLLLAQTVAQRHRLRRVRDGRVGRPDPTSDAARPLPEPAARRAPGASSADPTADPGARWRADRRGRASLSATVAGGGTMLDVVVDQQGDFSPYLLTIGWRRDDRRQLGLPVR